MCPGCIIEATRQRKTAIVENEILEATTTNNTLAPMLEYITAPVKKPTALAHPTSPQARRQHIWRHSIPRQLIRIPAKQCNSWKY